MAIDKIGMPISLSDDMELDSILGPLYLAEGLANRFYFRRGVSAFRAHGHGAVCPYERSEESYSAWWRGYHAAARADAHRHIEGMGW